jgi:hypothetical protein
MDRSEERLTAALELGRAGVGRPRKDSKVPTLKQLGISKWEARRMFALAGLREQLDERIPDIVAHTRGRSLTSIIEQNSRQGRRRNPLFRAWRVALPTERAEFLDAVQRAAFFAERQPDLADMTEHGAQGTSC